MSQSAALSSGLAAPHAGSEAFTPAPRRRLHGLCAERQAAAKLRAELLRHVGDNPSPVQLAIIDSAAELKLKIAVIDARFIAEGGMSPHARREYLAFVNSFTRLLRQLGLKAADARPPTLAELFSRPAAGA